MKLFYDRANDSLYIDLDNEPGVDSFEVADGVVIDITAEGGVSGIDIAHASRRLDLDALTVTEGQPKPDGGASAAR